MIKNLIHVFNGKLSVKASFCLYFLIFSFFISFINQWVELFFFEVAKKNLEKKLKNLKTLPIPIVEG